MDDTCSDTTVCIGHVPRVPYSMIACLYIRIHALDLLYNCFVKGSAESWKEDFSMLPLYMYLVLLPLASLL